MKQQNKEKLSDRAFARLIATSILGIVVCLICLCSTTYAWFSDSIPSNNNEIKTASQCLLSVSVYKDGTEFEDVESGVTLEQGVTYTVELSLPKDSASGYCLIETATATYYTDYIARHESEDAQTLSFTLTVAKSQNVTFTPHWGIYSGEIHVTGGGQLHIS